MPILTRINGNPASVRTVAVWLSDLSSAIDSGCMDKGRSIHESSDEVWRDDAGNAFRDRLSDGMEGAWRLVLFLGDLATAVGAYADALDIAQQKMERARTHARQHQLIVTDTEILDPGPPKIQTERGEIDQTLAGQYDSMVTAYNQAREDAEMAERLLGGGWAYVRELLDQLFARESKFFTAVSFVGGWTHNMAGVHTDALTNTARERRLEAERARSWLRGTSDQSVDRRFYRDLVIEKNAEALQYERRVEKALRVGKAIRLTGWSVILAGAGYEYLVEGKPIGKIAFTTAAGVGGAAASDWLIRRIVLEKFGGFAARATVRVATGVIASTVAEWTAGRLYEEYKEHRESKREIVDDPLDGRTSPTHKGGPLS